MQKKGEQQACFENLSIFGTVCYDKFPYIFDANDNEVGGQMFSNFPLLPGGRPWRRAELQQGSQPASQMWTSHQSGGCVWAWTNSELRALLELEPAARGLRSRPPLAGVFRFRIN